MGKQQKNYFAACSDKMKILIDDPDACCVVSDQISVDGRRIGVMYRDFPLPNAPDSGWVFLSGFEDDAYMNTPGNNAVFPLNTVCNYDPSIVDYLDADYETAYVRNEDGTFVRDGHFFSDQD